MVKPYRIKSYRVRDKKVFKNYDIFDLSNLQSITYIKNNESEQCFLRDFEGFRGIMSTFWGIVRVFESQF